MTESSPLRIVIVGAGIAGLSLAAALHNSFISDRIKVTLYDRSSGNSEAGAAMHLTPNATRLVNKWGFNSERIQAVKLFRTKLFTPQLIPIAPTEQVDSLEAFGAEWYLNHRVSLRDELEELVEDGSVIYNAKIKAVDCDNAKITFEDGSQVTADLMVGADGVYSTVRKAVLDDDKMASPRYSGLSTYRCLIEMDSLHQDVAQMFSDTEFMCALGKQLKIVLYKCKRQGRDNLNVVAIFAVDEDGAAEKKPSAAELVSEMTDKFSDFHPKLVKILSSAKECSIWPLYDVDPLPTWIKGKTVLIGDAAHAMLPNLGQGGAQSIEDAFLLSELIVRYVQNEKTSLEKTLKMFESLRRDRTTHCQLASRHLDSKGDAETKPEKTSSPFETLYDICRYRLDQDPVVLSAVAGI